MVDFVGRLNWRLEPGNVSGRAVRRQKERFDVFWQIVNISSRNSNQSNAITILGTSQRPFFIESNKCFMLEFAQSHGRRWFIFSIFLKLYKLIPNIFGGPTITLLSKLWPSQFASSSIVWDVSLNFSIQGEISRFCGFGFWRIWTTCPPCLVFPKCAHKDKQLTSARRIESRNSVPACDILL